MKKSGIKNTSIGVFEANIFQKNEISTMYYAPRKLRVASKAVGKKFTTQDGSTMFQFRQTGNDAKWNCKEKEKKEPSTW